MSFDARQPFTASKLLEDSHGGTGRFARQGNFSGDDTWLVGTDQAVSKARLTIDAAWSDKSHVARNIETFRLPLHYINPAVRR